MNEFWGVNLICAEIIIFFLLMLSRAEGIELMTIITFINLINFLI